MEIGSLRSCVPATSLTPVVFQKPGLFPGPISCYCPPMRSELSTRDSGVEILPGDKRLDEAPGVQCTADESPRDSTKPCFDVVFNYPPADLLTTYIAARNTYKKHSRGYQSQIFPLPIKGNLASAKLAHTLFMKITGSYESL